MLSFYNDFSLKESTQEKSTCAAVTFNLKCLSDRLTLCHLLHFFFEIFLQLALEKCKIDWKSRDSLCLQSLPVGARWTTAWETSRTWLPVARGAFVTSGLPMQWWKNQTRRAPTERGTWPHSSAAKKRGKKNKNHLMGSMCDTHCQSVLTACEPSLLLLLLRLLFVRDGSGLYSLCARLLQAVWFFRLYIQ